MKRVIVKYEKLTTDILDMLIEKYPDGYEYNDIIKFKNKEGVEIKTIEVRTEDIIYLVKISEKLEQTMIDYMDDEDSYIDDNFDDDGLLI